MPAAIVGLVTLLAMGLAAPATAQEPGDAVIYLVRHAETGPPDGTPSDAPLSQVGRDRAWRLAIGLADAGLTSVHSTDLRRTRTTAEAVAATTGLEVEIYDPSDGPAMEALLDRLRAPGRHLVVGHSNTTPVLVEALGGDPVSPIPESEYDRLYVVTVTSDGQVVSTLLRYGEPGSEHDASL
jgi:broad specificity phosphatase PhoE